VTFFRDTLSVPVDELDELRSTELWPPIVGDAEATLRDLRALSRHDFKAERFRDLVSRCCSKLAPKAYVTSTLPTPWLA
jgi:hypothetical protein